MILAISAVTTMMATVTILVIMEYKQGYINAEILTVKMPGELSKKDNT